MLLCREHPPRKRHREQSTITDDRPPKRTKPHYSHPPQFWDSLSQITLTRNALKELDRRVALRNLQRAEIVEVVRRTRLLRSDTRQLNRIAKDGGYNMSHLRGYAGRQPAQSNTTPSNTAQSSSRNGKRTRDSGLAPSTRTSTTGPYDPQFEQMLIDNGIFPTSHRTPDGRRPPQPNNISEIRQMMARSRPSLSPSKFSDTAFEEFQDMNDRARSESKAMSSVIPIITGARDRYYMTEENQKFNNLNELAPGLRAAQPDKYYGADPSQVNPRVRRDLSQYIVPTTDTTRPVAPNFFFEGKSAAGKPDVAQRQLMKDNAYGARGMLHLQNYGKKTLQYDGNAYTVGSSYHPGTGTLQIYATYPRESAVGGTEYYMTQLNGYQMTGNIDTFRHGAAAYRNMRDFTQEQRDLFIASANSTANATTHSASDNVLSSRSGSSTRTSFAMANFSFESDTSSDECLSSERDGRPRKRASQTTTAAGGSQSTRHESGQQASNNESDSSNDDDDYITADGEEGEDE